MVGTAGQAPTRVGGQGPRRGVCVEPTTSEIRRQPFELVRRGFDPQEVGVFLERIAEMISDRDKQLAAMRSEIQTLERGLTEARLAEEAVRLTMIAATKTKDEILAAAEKQAEERLQSATSTAEASITEARREALALIEESRSDAEALMASARQEHDDLLTGMETLRSVVKKTGTLLKGMASGALGELSQAVAILDSLDEHGEADIGLVLGTETGEVALSRSGTADPIDRLLEQLRNVD